MTRYFEHALPDTPYRVPEDTCVSAIANIATSLLGNVTDGESVYTGVAGVSYALLRLVTSASIEFPIRGGEILLRQHIWSQLLRDVRSAMHAMRQQSERRHGWSLFCGHAGIYATTAMVLHEAALAEGLHSERASNLREESQRALQRFQNLSILASTFSVNSIGFPDDEVLYGRSGYLLGLLNVTHLAPIRPESVVHIVRALIDAGKVQSQRYNHPCPLVYAWPTGHRAQLYIGAAHGLMGVLYALLHYQESLEELGEMPTVVQCLQYVLSQEVDATGLPGSHGFFRSSLESRHSPLVQWCHGSAGAVFLFAKAYEVLHDDVYFQAARRAGEVVWRRGLLKKGPGLCHGISGNGYALLRLYRLTGEETYLSRAFRFAEFILSPHFHASNVPDHPWSLYEGWAGALCFFVDLLDPLHARFPFFEV